MWMMAKLCGNQQKMWPMGRSAQAEANWTEADDSDGIVTDESKDAINNRGLCHIILSDVIVQA